MSIIVDGVEVLPPEEDGGGKGKPVAAAPPRKVPPRPARAARRASSRRATPGRARGLLNLQPVLGLPLAVPLGQVPGDVAAELCGAADAASRGAPFLDNPRAFVNRLAAAFLLRAVGRAARQLRRV